MPLSVAIQMDPIEAVDIRADSTFRIALEATARGHELFYYQVPDLVWDGGRVMASGWPLEVRPEPGNHYTLGPRETRDLATMDVTVHQVLADSAGPGEGGATITSGITFAGRTP